MTPRHGGWAYHRGELVPFDQAVLPVTTQALHYGTGVFEGIRAHAVPSGLALFRVHDHYERFLRSCRFLRIDVGHTPDELTNTTMELLRCNGFTVDCYVRPLGYKLALEPGTPPGVGLTGISSGWSIVASVLGPYHRAAGIRCAISSWRRTPRASVPPQVKLTGGYVNNALAADEARGLGCDDTILLDERGNVAEASTANVVALVGGRLVTPPPGADVLAGITRDTVLTLADELGVDTAERDLPVSQLLLADEVFLTGTGVGVVPVVEAGGRRIGDGVPGPVTTKLVESYAAVVREGHPRHDWLTTFEVD